MKQTFKEFLIEPPEQPKEKKDGSNIVIRKMTKADTKEALNVAGKIFRSKLPITQGSFEGTCKNACDGNIARLSYVAVDGEEIVGGYFLGSHQLLDIVDPDEDVFAELDGKFGIEGVALFLKEEYRSSGVGKKLRTLPYDVYSNTYDYIWGQHAMELNNTSLWLDSGRQLAYRGEGVDITYKVFNK